MCDRTIEGPQTAYADFLLNDILTLSNRAVDISGKPELAGLDLLCSSYNVTNGRPARVFDVFLESDHVGEHLGASYPDHVVGIEKRAEDKSEVVQFRSHEDYCKYRASEIQLKTALHVPLAAFSASAGSYTFSSWSTGHRLLYAFFRIQLYCLKFQILSQRDLLPRRCTLHFSLPFLTSNSAAPGFKSSVDDLPDEINDDDDKDAYFRFIEHYGLPRICRELDKLGSQERIVLWLFVWAARNRSCTWWTKRLPHRKQKSRLR